MIVKFADGVTATINTGKAPVSGVKPPSPNSNWNGVIKPSAKPVTLSKPATPAAAAGAGAAKQTGQSITASTPSSGFSLGGIFGGSNQKPEGIASMLTNPVFKPVSQAFLGMTGLPGLAFATSQLGDGGQSWKTLMRGKQAGFTPGQIIDPTAKIQAAQAAPTPRPEWKKVLLGNPEPGDKGIDLLTANRGQIAGTVGGAVAADRALTRAAVGPAGKPSAMFPGGRPPSLLAASKAWSNQGVNALANRAPTSVGKNLLGHVGRKALAAGGPFATPINAAIELYDMASSPESYQTQLDQHAQATMPDNTILGGVKTNPAVGYGGAAFNAWSNPIKSTHLLGRGVGELFGANGVEPIGRTVQTAGKLDQQVVANTDKMKDQLAARVNAFGLSSLTPGERANFNRWSTANRQVGPSVLDGLMDW